MTEKIKKALQRSFGLTETEAIEICDYVFHHAQISSANLQLKFRLGYNKADRIISFLELNGIVSKQDGTKPRTVLLKRS